MALLELYLVSSALNVLAKPRTLEKAGAGEQPSNQGITTPSPSAKNTTISNTQKEKKRSGEEQKKSTDLLPDFSDILDVVNDLFD